MKRELLSQAFGDLDDSFIAEAFRPVPGEASGASERIVHMKKKRMISFALAAALILALGISAYAAFGSRSVATRALPGTGDYTDYSEWKQIEDLVGYPVTAPERFSNGYVFSCLSVKGEAVYSEYNEVEQEYYVVHVLYTKPGSPDRSLDLSPVLAPAQAEDKELRMVRGLPVKLRLDHYKIVPEDYRKTEEDLARESAGHFFISFGSDSITEFDLASVDFVLAGVEYMLSDPAATEDTLEELVQMAAELLEAAA